MLYAPALHDLETIRILCRSVTKLGNVVMGTPGAAFDLAQLAEAQVKWVSFGSALARLTLGASLTGAREMMNQGSFRFIDRASGFAEIEAHFDACSASVTVAGSRL